MKHKVPSATDYDARLVGEAIRSIFDFAGPDVGPATAAALLSGWRHAERLTDRQRLAVVASFERIGVPCSRPDRGLAGRSGAEGGAQ